jgi:pilus assembly protein Flp/PilA
MTKLFAKFQAFASQDRGATAVEYGLLVGLIAVVIIVAVQLLGGTLEGIFSGVQTCLAAPSAANC